MSGQMDPKFWENRYKVAGSLPAADHAFPAQACVSDTLLADNRRVLDRWLRIGNAFRGREASPAFHGDVPDRQHTASWEDRQMRT